MRTKTKYPKTGICIRIRKDILEKVDKIADKKLMERSEFLRKIIEEYITEYNI